MSSISHLRATLNDTLVRLFREFALRDGVDDSDLSNCTLETLVDARQQVIEVVACELAPILETANAHRDPMQKLHPELIAEIFKHMWIGDRFTASYVCRHWRRVAIAHPAVWADMTAFGRSSPRLLLALQRSASSPIDLDFSLDPQSDLVVKRIATATALKLALPSMRSLSIDIRSDTFLLDAFDEPAPLLERFQISKGLQSRDVEHVIQLRSDIFGNSAPRLSCLRFKGIVLPHALIPAFAAVRELHLTPIWSDDMWHSLCEHTLIAMPDLETLHLDLLPRGEATAPFSSRFVPPLARLRNLWVGGLRNIGTGFLLALPHQMCSRVSLHNEGGGVPLEDLLEPLSSVKSMVIWCNLCAVTGDARQFSRMASFMPIHIPSSILTTSVTSYLQALVLQDVDGMLCKSQVFLPRLAYLELVLAASRDNASGFSYDNLESFPHDLRLVAPTLRVLRLTRHPSEISIAYWNNSVYREFMDVLTPDRDVWLEIDGLNVPDIPRTRRRPMTSVASTFASHTASLDEAGRAWAALERISDVALSALQNEE
ncbi:hypothetical protein EXIGLDRAFT_838623 [Exidia glandulosa HHB12029]|uniref:F-box domain-containing protein n=1 Tax=Exidia glandulosa HHB12029 TaxID=1314781 RepID=A0A165FN26_EXIGL|nr:hypothetical protein EXIGLDRAFT_838623 [Exidia glandulosa HHB12029]